MKPQQRSENLMGAVVARHRRVEGNGRGKVRAGRVHGGRGSVTFADEPYVRGLKDMTELFLVRYYSDI